MLYVSVLLASFNHSLLSTLIPLLYVHTCIRASIHPFCFIRSFSSPPSLSLSLSFLFFSRFSHDTLTIDYATSWQICVVLATMSYSRTRRLSPIANYIRSLLHLGELRVPGGFPFPQGERGADGRSARGAKTIYMIHKAVTRLPVMCDSRVGAIKLFELTRGDDDDDDSSSSPYTFLFLRISPN